MLIDLGDSGELVGQVILILAAMKATTRFEESKFESLLEVPIQTFSAKEFWCLFQFQAAVKAVDVSAFAGSCGGEMTLKRFVYAHDELSMRDMFFFFLTSCGVIRRGQAVGIDLIIPVMIEKTLKLIVVQIKNRANEYASGHEVLSMHPAVAFAGNKDLADSVVMCLLMDLAAYEDSRREYSLLLNDYAVVVSTRRAEHVATQLLAADVAEMTKQEVLVSIPLVKIRGLSATAYPFLSKEQIESLHTTLRARRGCCSRRRSALSCFLDDHVDRFSSGMHSRLLGDSVEVPMKRKLDEL
jgi:hypothetical protein